jgi:fatty acid desaturase
VTFLFLLGGGRYDWLCCFSNYHTEHHDFPDVPAFRLRELRDIAAPFYHTDVVAGGRDGWWETMRRTFAQRDFYACAGVSDLVSVATEPGGAAAAKGAVGQTR